jgi:hypothetical protein
MLQGPTAFLTMPNAPGERRPTANRAGNDQKACAVGRPLHWDVRHDSGEPPGLPALLPWIPRPSRCSRASVSRSWVTEKMREFEGADFLGAYLALTRQSCVPLCSTVKYIYPLTMSLASHYRAGLVVRPHAFDRFPRQRHLCEVCVEVGQPVKIKRLHY